MDQQPEDETLEDIYDALDAGEAERAAELAREALARLPEDDPVLRLLLGIALIDLDLPAEAAGHLSRAVEMDPDDAEARANLALALFRACRFQDAEREARAALRADQRLPDAHAVVALVLERQGRLREADEHEARAAELDPQRFPAPARLERSAFEAEVARAGERLPDRFRRLLDQVAVTVEEVPPDPIVFEEDPPLDPELLGLFVGLSLPERSHLDGVGHLPPRILLFQRNLERHSLGAEDLRKEIAVTLYHELGHFLGLDEEDLDELDLS